LVDSKTIRHHSSQQHVEITLLIVQGAEFRRQHRGSIYLSLIAVFFSHHHHHESSADEASTSHPPGLSCVRFIGELFESTATDTEWAHDA
ncbi:MAG: hypothetical protein ACOYLM_12975, partial [Methylococcaceae bacterium]